MPSSQVWRLTAAGATHRVETEPGFSKRVRWYVDDDLVAEKKTAGDKLRLEGRGDQLVVRFATLGAPRRATLIQEGVETDLVPDPGSAASLHEDRVRAHPGRYTALHTLIGAARVIVPIVLAAALARLAFSLPWPDWHVPTPDVPTPDLPSIPLPDWHLPDWELPGWLLWMLEHVHYIWPVVLAFVLARAEIRRRRTQDEKRDQLSEK